MVLRVRSQMTSRSLPFARETMSSAKACRYPGASLGVCERRSSTTKFHRKGDRMPPWGHPLRILMVLECGSVFVVDGDISVGDHVDDPVGCGWV